jgi:hypothetical protein
MKKITFSWFRNLTSLFLRTTVYSLRVIIFLLLTHYSVLPTLLHAQAGWKPDQRLTYFQGSSLNPQAACWGDTLHLVWWEHYGVSGETREEVYYKRSTNAGESWEADVLLSEEDEQSSILPSVAVSGDTVHIIWHEYDYGLLYRRSLDGGSTWQDIDSIVPGMGYSSIQVAGDTIYIIGISAGSLQFTKSINGGNNWEPVLDITSASASPTLRNISNDASNLVVSYRGYPTVETYIVRSFNAGQNWLDSQIVSDDDNIGSQRPAMDTDDSSGIHITWFDYKYSPYPWTGDIFYRASRDSGNSWETIDSLTTQHRAVASDILAEGNNLHLVWEDDRNDFGNNFEIYYRMSTDLGQTWGVETRLTDALEWSISPSLACDHQFLHLFWSDQRDDSINRTDEIYYKRKDLSGAIIETNKSSLVLNLKFDVYPNPFGTDIRLQITDERYKEIENIKIFDVLGKEVMVYKMRKKEREIRIDCKDLPAGVYFLQVEAGKERLIKKVEKVR